MLNAVWPKPNDGNGTSHRAPWHPSAPLQPSQHSRRLPPLPILPRPPPPPPKFSESRRRPVDDRRPWDLWHPSAPLQPSQHSRHLPHSRSYPGRRRRNIQSPAAVPWTIGVLGTPGTPPPPLQPSQHSRRLPPLPILPRPPPPKFSESRRRCGDGFQP